MQMLSRFSLASLRIPQIFAGTVERPAMEQCLRSLTASFCGGALADEVAAVKVFC